MAVLTHELMNLVIALVYIFDFSLALNIFDIELAADHESAYYYAQENHCYLHVGRSVEVAALNQIVG